MQKKETIDRDMLKNTNYLKEIGKLRFIQLLSNRHDSDHRDIPSVLNSMHLYLVPGEV